MDINDLHRMLTEGLRAERMNPTPFQGGQSRWGKHAAGHAGQTYRKRHGKTKPSGAHPSTVALTAVSA